MNRIDFQKGIRTQKTHIATRIFAALAAFALPLVALLVPAAAQTPATWTFDGNGVWSDGSKWTIGGSTGVVPGVNHDVTIDDGDTIVTVTVNDSRSVNTLTMGNSDTLDIQAGASFVTFTSANSFTNSGNLLLTNFDESNSTTRLTVSTGTLTNAPSGLLRFGVGNGARLFDGDLLNNGTVQINKDTTFDKSVGTYANHASLSVAGGATLTIGGTGTLKNETGGTLDLDGTLDVGNSTYNHNAGTLDFGTNALIQNGTFNYLGGTIVGTPKLKAMTFTLGPGTNPVQILMNNHNTLASHVNANQTINIEGNQSFVILTSANSFTNSGNLLLTNFDESNSTTRLTVSTGTLTNAPSGLLRFGVGNGARLFDGDLLNNGTVQINKDTTFDKSVGTYANHASLSVAGGATLTIGGTGTLKNETGGTLDLDGTLDVGNSTYNHNAGTLDFGTNALIQNGTFNYLGGTIVGTPKLKAMTFTLGPGTNPVQILMNDHNTLASHLNANQSILVRGDQSFVILTSANSFTNSGSIFLSNVGTSNATTRFTVTAGALTNAPSGLLHFQAGLGARLFDGNLLNNGMVRVSTDTTFDKSTATYTNTGTLQVDSGATLTINTGGVLTNQSGSTLTGGTFDITGKLRYPAAQIVTNQAEIILRGNGAQIIDQTDDSNAIANLSTNGANGKLRLLANRNWVSDSFTNHGVLEMGGGDFQVTSFTNSATGEIRGSGHFVGTVNSSGLVAPGSSPGTLTINNYIQDASGTLAIELAGALNGQSDKLVTGFANLAGTLNVSLSGGFLPKPLDTFDILDLGSRTGTFGDVNLPLQNVRIFWNQSQLYVNGSIKVDATYYAGDFNRDSEVTPADIQAMLKALTNLSSYATTNSLTQGQLNLIGDLNGVDGVTNRDIQGLLNLLAAQGSGSITAVPEPATFVLLCCAVPVFFLRRRISRQ